MRQDREQHNAGSPHLGPVTPPSLGEVYEISTRRQRTRYRFIQGTLVAVAVAGVGVGLQSRAGDSIQSPAATGEASDDGGLADDSSLTAAEEDLSTPEADPAPAIAAVDCPQSQTADGTAAWMEDGRVAYVENSAVPIEELEELADQWQIPLLEVKGLAGVAGEVDASLFAETIDEALFDWYEEGYTAEQLGELAAEWNVTSISVKVLQLLGGPQAEASLTECGLS